MNFRRLRHAKVLPVSLMALVGALTFHAKAQATPTWTEVPAPGNVVAVAVGPADVPYVVTSGSSGGLWYLGYGQGECSSGALRICADKWIPVASFDPIQLSTNAGGFLYVADGIQRLVSANGVADPNWRPNGDWTVLSGGRCITAAAVTGELTGNVAFRPQTPVTNWSGALWTIGCGPPEHDYPISVLHRWADSAGVHDTGWQPVAQRQHATSTHVAIFSRVETTGTFQDVWFLDSLGSGGLTWIYDSSRDRVVNVPNPPDPASTQAVPPLLVGTSITDHYERFQPHGSTTPGSIYRWDDAAQRWVYVIGDPPTGFRSELAHAAAYNANSGRVGPSRLWAASAGRLYVLFDQVVK